MLPGTSTRRLTRFPSAPAATPPSPAATEKAASVHPSRAESRGTPWSATSHRGIALVKTIMGRWLKIPASESGPTGPVRSVASKSRSCEFGLRLRGGTPRYTSAPSRMPEIIIQGVAPSPNRPTTQRMRTGPSAYPTIPPAVKRLTARLLLWPPAPPASVEPAGCRAAEPSPATPSRRKRSGREGATPTRLSRPALSTMPSAVTARRLSRSPSAPRRGWGNEVLKENTATSSASIVSVSAKRSCRVGRSAGTIPVNTSFTKWPTASRAVSPPPASAKRRGRVRAVRCPTPRPPLPAGVFTLWLRSG